ncbi:MAG: M6 family metalloprotease domain-containing protein, partial [Candidatus Marinimicrobia bacterium]|nr:M6 family metalloprotease domain-containing protein [Candidatus Neomarinimicrobiota bacterium]
MRIVRTIVVLLFMTGSLLAIIAKPGIITKRQPDGTEIQLVLQGDKWQHWYETAAGYSVTENEEGEWVYVQQVVDGRLVPGAVKVTGRIEIDSEKVRDLPKHLKPLRRAISGALPAVDIAATGVEDFNIPVLLINYPDMEHKYRKQNFLEMMNEDNYKNTGSFRDYFSEVSYGQFMTMATVLGWFTAENEHDYYAEEATNATNRQVDLARYAVDQAEVAGIDWSQYDNDGNGRVDGVVIIHAGRGAEEGDDSNIWSFKGDLRHNNKQIQYDGVWIDVFSMQPEKYHNSMSSIGVFVHEYGHIIGLPDLYDTDDSSDGIGNWGLMAGGGWGGDGGSPWKPSHPCAWAKIKLGWLEPTDIDSFTTDLEIVPVENSPVVYRIKSSTDSSERFLLSNRRKTGFDENLPESGLLIWHIDTEKTSHWPGSNNINNDEPHYGVGLEQADGRFDLENGSNRGDKGDPYPGMIGNHIYDNESMPNSRSYYSEPSYVAVYDIAEEGDLIKAKVWVPNSEVPYLTLESYSFQIISGDDDGLINPGETAALRVVLANSENAGVAAGVSVEASADDPTLSIISGVANFPDINPGVTGVNITEKIEFVIAAGITPRTIPLHLQVSSGEGATLFEFQQTVDVEVVLDQEGFPFVESGAVMVAPAIADIDLDGDPEIVAASDDFDLYVIGSNGELKWTFATGNKIRSTPAIGDLEGDGTVEIVFGSVDKNLYVLDDSGKVKSQYEAEGFIRSTVVLKDMDSDGDLEIIFGDLARKLYVINHDATDYGSFPVDMGESLMTSPAVGDLDGDDASEIVVGTWQKNVYALKSDGSVVAGFPYATGGKIDTDPALADLDGDGKPEIIVGSADDKVHVIQWDGSARFVYATGADVLGSPVADDLDGDGSLEIFFGSNDQLFYGIDSDGNDLPGWPQQVESNVQTAPVFFDFDNDGVAEIVSAERGGLLSVFSLSGERLPNFPVEISSPVQGSFTVANVDGDGDAEIAVGTGRGIELIDIKSSSGIGYYWSSYRGGPHRTGFLGDSKLIVDEKFVILPASFQLYQNYPNPFNPTTAIRYDLPQQADVELTIYNVLGRQVAVAVNGWREQGRHEVMWDGTDNFGRSVSAGVYLYQIRAGDFSR